MQTRKRIIFVALLTLIIGTGAALSWLKAHQKLGTPGVKATALEGTAVMDIQLPEKVLDYVSTNIPQPAVVTDFLPKDTSYAQRLYTAPDGFTVQANVILMGSDRTSIHRPEYCLPGQGLQIHDKSVVNLTILEPREYQMPVAKWTVRNFVKQPDGSSVEISGLYVFWFVADDQQTTSHDDLKMWLTRDLLRKGVLQRWAYVSYFVRCMPGQEDATFERLSQMIVASVPEFQHPPSAVNPAAIARN